MAYRQARRQSRPAAPRNQPPAPGPRQVGRLPGTPAVPRSPVEWSRLGGDSRSTANRRAGTRAWPRQFMVIFAVHTAIHSSPGVVPRHGGLVSSAIHSPAADARRRAAGLQYPTRAWGYSG